MGTLGGNLCQRNRCWYFRDEHVNCLLKGGDKCFALDGENRYHAIFTQGHKCVIVNPSTLAPVLIALGATAEVLGPKGKRTMRAGQVLPRPSSAGGARARAGAQRDGAVGDDSGDKGLKNASYEVRHKQSYDWPLVQAAVAFKLDGGKASDVQDRAGPRGADAARRRGGRQGPRRQGSDRRRRPPRPARPRPRAPSRSARTATRSSWSRWPSSAPS